MLIWLVIGALLFGLAVIVLSVILWLASPSRRKGDQE